MKVTSLQAGIVVAVLSAGLLMASGGTESAEGAPPTWGRSFATSGLGDTIAVPVRWNASCDDLGCADSYRVTWGVEYMAAAVAPDSADDSGLRLLTDAAMTNVIREVIVTGTADTARVPAPPVLNPATVCVYIVAIRRGLASGVSAACRTIEAPDVAPPEVDGINFDSMRVDTTAALFDTLQNGDWRMNGAYSLWNYRATVGDDSVQRLDSVPGNVGQGITRTRPARVAVGDWFYFCMHMQRGTERVVLVPLRAPYTQAQLAAYMDRCSAAIADRYSVSRERFRYYLTPEFVQGATRSGA